MRKRIGAVALAAATAFTLLITGCGSGSSGSGDNTLYVLTTDTTIGLDPATNVNFPTTWLGLISRRLTTWDVTDGGDAQVVPDLATDIGTPNEDGTVWTYTLKDDIFFENGDPITSADIKWGIERTFAPELAGGLTYHVGLLEGGSEYTGPFDGATLDSIETPDDKTIIFHLTQPFGDWPWLVAMNPFAPVPEGEGTDAAEYARTPISSGPYKVKSNTDGTETVLVRNEFWKKETDDQRTAGPDKIVFEQSQNPTTIAQSLIADVGTAKNSINALQLGAAELALATADPSVGDRLITSDGGVQYYATLNNKSPELSNVKVRQAIEYATDRDSIVLAAGGEDAAAPATSLIPPGIPGHDDYDLYPYDVDKAKQLLTEAGYPDGITLDLWVANEDTSAAEALQASLAKAGITVNITPLDIATLYGDVMGGSNDYDIFLSYWIGDYPSPASNISLLFDSAYIDGGYNTARYSNPDVDAAMAAATGTTDTDEAAAMWGDIDKQIMKDAPMVPLYVTKNSFLRGSNVSHYFTAGYPPFPNYLKFSLGE